MMRILDLGAHDGFVTHFIARQARSQDIELHIDGVEANHHGVSLFNERAQAQGIPGECKQGLVEDAPDLFERHSYDAVVLYELIEHALDPDELLEVAERMCKPGGRVYVSTPNGTFGEGKNPHHLHTWRIIDLCDLVRWHGHIHDVLPGPDGVSVLSYTPRPQAWHRKEVGIYCGPGWEKWSPVDIQTKGLGGSETAAVKLAEALAATGALVTVYGEVEPGMIGQVVYRHHHAFDPMEERDILIISRISEVLDRRIKARAKILWMHDSDAGERLTKGRAEYADRILCLSGWHHDHLLRTYPFLHPGKLYITRNGINPNYFMRDDIERNPHRAIYTSSPDRGLDLLLDWWPEVRRRVPDAELAFAYASVYEAVAKASPAIANFRQLVASLQDQPGVVNLGALSQPQVAEQMLASGVWLAPSYSTPAGVPFKETFCIGAVEAAAAGCKRVMAAWGALLERDEQPLDMTRWVNRGASHRERFIDAIVEAMTDSGIPHTRSETALGMNWDEVAADVLAVSQDIPS